MQLPLSLTVREKNDSLPQRHYFTSRTLSGRQVLVKKGSSAVSIAQTKKLD
tara:strand:- start:148705 stop:148857 length:153 start_codon:yes stop_codon:yes gene_type:complete